MQKRRGAALATVAALALALVLGGGVVSAHADEGTVVTVATEQELTEALEGAAAAQGSPYTIQLSEDIELSDHTERAGVGVTSSSQVSFAYALTDGENVHLTSVPGEKHTLRLGDELFGKNSGSAVMFFVNGTGRLTLSNLTIDANSSGGSPNKGSAACVEHGGTLTIEDGAVLTGSDGRVSGSAGALHVAYGAKLVMNGGELTGNDPGSSGGMLAVISVINSSFEMNGGTISDNTVVLSKLLAAAQTQQGRCGIVAINTDVANLSAHPDVAGSPSTFVMNGGTISGNANPNGYGGAISAGMPDLNRPEVTGVSQVIVNGGTIEGNTALGGGAISVCGNKYYAGEGGALYVASTVKNVGGTCLIDRCGFFNNAAGQRSGIENAGGAVCLAGAGTIVNTAIFNNENGGVNITATDGAAVVNSTVTRNTGSGIDGKDKTVNNTVIWGNSLLSTSDAAKPAFNHCAYPEANADGQPDGDGNIYLDSRNNEEQGPHFDAPSVKTGFDTDYMPSTTFYPLWTWVPLEGSYLIDKGDNDKYLSSYGNVDLDGYRRVRNNTIDIGAFEYQPVSSSRIRYVKKDGTGDGTGSWDNASANLQAMIDELAESGDGQPGEVWVAAGEYEPLTQLIPGTSHTASFRMRNGVSVYGGFQGTETAKTDRKKGAMPWQFVNKTILSAAYYSADNLEFSNNKWTTTSDSRHVVWFAPMEGEADFTMPTYLDGVTVRGGYAQGGTGLDDFKTDRGAGVYMDGENTYLVNSTVTECYATGNGGGVYLRGGRVQTSLIYNNNADQGGGAVYVDGQGLVHRSMLANNSARNGAGAYLNHTEGTDPEYLVVSTCVVSNNTSTGNGAIYCNGGGVLLQNTIVNNRCVTATDLTDPNASQTGGLYLNGYGLVVNSVIWNNRMGTGDNPVNVPMYARNPSADNVRFMYNAISGVNNAVWNNTLQEQTLSLVDANQGEPDNPASIGPRFEEPAPDSGFGTSGLDGSFGVQSDWREISYYWQPIEGSNLWARGMALGMTMMLPEEDRYSRTRLEMLDDMVIDMGGRVAEEITFGDITGGASADISHATNVAHAMVCRFGMSEKLGTVQYGERSDHIYLGRDITRSESFSEETAREIDLEVKRLVMESKKRCEQILNEHKDKLDKLAEALLEKETMNVAEIREETDFGTEYYFHTL